MDGLESAASNTTSTTIGPPRSASTQPTYTTAGTIYNPSSSQPLQPPTRRGRSAKWSTGQNSDLCLFPKTLLAGFTMQATNGSLLATTLQQYTPLQQNYDRAVSPLSELDHAAHFEAIQTPRMRSGNIPAPLSFLFPDKDDERDVAKAKLAVDEYANFSNDEDADEDDDDQGMEALMNMTVKSLNNLASYPQPEPEESSEGSLPRSASQLGRPRLGEGRCLSQPISQGHDPF